MTFDDKLYYPSRSKNDTDSTTVLFEARDFFKKYTTPYAEYRALTSINSKVSFENRRIIPFSDLYRENSLYGTIDDEGDIISPLPTMSNFRSVGNDIDGNIIYLQNFVADAMTDMVKYLDDRMTAGCVGALPADIAGSQFLHLKVKKAYKPSSEVSSLYSANAVITANKFKEYCNSNKGLDSAIKDPVEFTKHYLYFLKDHIDIIPATKTRFQAAMYFESLNNGITFSLSDDDCGDDENKYEKYMLDKMFLMFSDACIRYGFRMDKNNIFLLHADLNSPAMKPYLQKYGLTDYKDVFKKRYKKIYVEDIESLKEYFIDSYKSFLTNNNYYKKYVNEVKYVSEIKILTRKTLESEQDEKNYFRKFPDSFWIKLYIQYKSSELKYNFNNKEIEYLTRKTSSMYSLNKKDGLKYINDKFNELKNNMNFSSSKK